MSLTQRFFYVPTVKRFTSAKALMDEYPEESENYCCPACDHKPIEDDPQANAPMQHAGSGMSWMEGRTCWACDTRYNYSNGFQ